MRSKMRLLVFGLVAIVAFALLPTLALAADANSDGYNDNDFSKLQSFLNQPSAIPDKTNGQALNSAYDQNNPTTWTGVSWTYGGEKYVTFVDWDHMLFASALDLSGCTKLGSLYCDNNQLTSLDVSGCTELIWLSCNDNQLTSLNVTGGDNKLVNLYCQNNHLQSLDIRDYVFDNLDTTGNQITSITTRTWSSVFVIKLTANGNGYVGVRELTKYPPIEDINPYPDGTQFSLEVVASPKPGQSFINWTRTGAEVSTAQVYSLPTGYSYGLVANFSGAPYKVTFDPQGGTVSPTSIEVTPPATKCGTLPTPSRTGYTFAGWYTGTSGTGTQFTSNTPVTASIKVYANWNIKAPTGLKARAYSCTAIYVYWDSESAAAYEVWRIPYGGSSYVLAGMRPNNSFINYELVTGKKYYFKVRSYRWNGSKKVYSGWSDVVYATPAPAMPEISVASVSYISNQITWKKIAGASGYEVDRATSAAGAFSKLTTLPASSTSYTDTGLTTGKFYYYKVRAYRWVGSAKVYGDFSAVDSDKPVPYAPVVKASRASSSSVKLTWDAVAGATKYAVYRSLTGAPGSYTSLGTTSSLSFSSTGLTEGIKYYYKVRAYHLEGSSKVYGLYSEVVSAIP